jgi:hypothetical protein
LLNYDTEVNGRGAKAAPGGGRNAALTRCPTHQKIGVKAAR